MTFNNGKAWETIEAENPKLWNEFKSNDINGMIDELVQYKKAHYPDDRRRILTCGIPDGKVRVEWVPAADSGVDSKWEMQLYGLLRTGQKDTRDRRRSHRCPADDTDYNGWSGSKVAGIKVGAVLPHQIERAWLDGPARSRNQTIRAGLIVGGRSFLRAKSGPGKVTIRRCGSVPCSTTVAVAAVQSLCRENLAK